MQEVVGKVGCTPVVSAHASALELVDMEGIVVTAAFDSLVQDVEVIAGSEVEAGLAVGAAVVELEAGFA